MEVERKHFFKKNNEMNRLTEQFWRIFEQISKCVK